MSHTEPLPLTDTVHANTVARAIRIGREVGLVDGPELAVFMANNLFNTFNKRTQFINLADPKAARADA